MGVWGHRYYDNDAALDFMIEVEESDQPKEALRRAIESALAADDLKAEEGRRAIVAATYIDRQVNGTTFTPGDAAHLLDVDDFPLRHPEIDLVDLQQLAVKALYRVQDTGAEKELWAVPVEDYPAWRAGVEQLIRRLEP